MIKDEVKEIVEIMLWEVFSCLGDCEIILIVSDKFKDCLIEDGFDFSYGVRFLCWVIMCLLEDVLVEVLLVGKI